MSELINIYSLYLNESIDINRFEATNNIDNTSRYQSELLNQTINNIWKKKYNNKEKDRQKALKEILGEYKLGLLNYMIINKINKQSKGIIEYFIKPLLSASLEVINNSRFRYRCDITAKTNSKLLIDIQAKTNSRLLINTASGLGKTVFEVGLNIHPLFSIPYIPSSTIKGSLRSYIHNNHKDKEYIFGDQEKIGKLIILDAFPINFDKRLVDGEVTTPIYSEDIQEHKVKSTPIIYPCIAKGVTFRFIAACDNDELRNEIHNYFLAMLKEGIGAKTLLGYGELR